MLWQDLLAMERRVEEVNDWRHCPVNRYTDGDLALVSKVSTAKRDLKAAVREAVDAIGGVRRALSPGDRVLLKPNFNSADPPPARTDLEFLAAVVGLLREEGITDLTLGERCGWPALPTAEVFRQVGLYEAARELGLRVLEFDRGPWMDVRMGKRARWWEKVAFPRCFKEFDKIVYLPCLKTHRLGRFTISLKLPVGMTHPAEMVYMHADFRGGKPHEPMYLKMIELSIPVGPDLIIADGRKAFVTEGPTRGELVEPRVLLASGDRIALDAEGVKILQAYPRDNLLKEPFWQMPIVTRAIELGLGVHGESDYRVIG